MTRQILGVVVLVWVSVSVQADGIQSGKRSGYDSCPDSERAQHRGHRHGGHRGGGHRHRHQGEGSESVARRSAGRGGCGRGGHRHWNVPQQQARTLNPVDVSLDSLVRGKDIYVANCLRCHGGKGLGDGPDAQGLSVAPVNLGHAVRMHSDGELSYMIQTGRDPMPAWKDKLSAAEIWDVINYIRFDIGGRAAARYSDWRESGNPDSDREQHAMHKRAGKESDDHHDGHEHEMEHDGSEHHQEMDHDMHGDHEDHMEDMRADMQERHEEMHEEMHGDRHKHHD